MGVIASIAKVSYTTDLHIYWQCSKCGNINEKSITISEKGVGFQPGRNARTQTAGNHAQFMAFSSINQYLKTAEALQVLVEREPACNSEAEKRYVKIVCGKQNQGLSPESVLNNGRNLFVHRLCECRKCRNKEIWASWEGTISDLEKVDKFNMPHIANGTIQVTEKWDQQGYEGIADGEIDDLKHDIGIRFKYIANAFFPFFSEQDVEVDKEVLYRYFIDLNYWLRVVDAPNNGSLTQVCHRAFNSGLKHARLCKNSGYNACDIYPSIHTYSTSESGNELLFADVGTERFAKQIFKRVKGPSSTEETLFKQKLDFIEGELDAVFYSYLDKLSERYRLQEIQYTTLETMVSVFYMGLNLGMCLLENSSSVVDSTSQIQENQSQPSKIGNNMEVWDSYNKFIEEQKAIPEEPWTAAIPKTQALMQNMFVLSVYNSKSNNQEKKEEENNRSNMTEVGNIPEGDPIKCPMCGKEIPADSKFCQFCGKRIQIQTEVTTQPVIPVPQKTNEKHTKQWREQSNNGKTKSVFPILSILLIIALFFSNVLLLANKNTIKKENEILQESIKKAEEEIVKKDQTIKAQEKTIQQAQNKIEEYEAKVDSLNISDSTISSMKTWLYNHSNEFQLNSTFMASTNVVFVRVGNTTSITVTSTKNGSLSFSNQNSRCCRVEWGEKWIGNTIALEISGMREGLSAVTITRENNTANFQILIFVYN